MRILKGFAISCAVLFMMLVASADTRSAVVVTTSMLESAVYELFGDDLPFDLERIIPPGNCPGHFDLRPQTLNRIRSAWLFAYHDYQHGIENRVKDQARFARLLRIEVSGSYLIPENYAATVASLREVFVDAFPDVKATNAADSVAQVERLWQGAANEHEWRGVPVIASQLQAGFCEWLGFDVVGIIRRPEDMTPLDLARLLDTGAELIVANRQSDSQAARMLADRLSLPLAVLDNFPGDRVAGVSPYLAQAEKNLEALIRAWQTRL